MLFHIKFQRNGSLSAAAKKQLNGKKVCGKAVRIRPKFSKHQSQRYYDDVIQPIIHAREAAGRADMARTILRAF